MAAMSLGITCAFQTLSQEREEKGSHEPKLAFLLRKAKPFLEAQSRLVFMSHWPGLCSLATPSYKKLWNRVVFLAPLVEIIGRRELGVCFELAIRLCLSHTKYYFHTGFL